MDSEKDHQKLLSMKEMIAEKSRKSQREKQIEQHRLNPFLDSKRIIQSSSIPQILQVQSEINNPQRLNDKILAQIEQFEQGIELEQDEIDHFQKITLDSFKFRLSKLTPDNINSEDSVKLLENIPEFFKENNKSEKLIRKFKDEGCLEILHKFVQNLENYKPIPYQLVNIMPSLIKIKAKIIEIFTVFAQVEEYIDLIWKDNDTINLFLNLCVDDQDQQVLEELFSLLAFLCSDSGIEKRDYIRSTPLISYLCRQIDKFSMNTNFVASIIVRNGIWLLVSLCSDLPLEGKHDYCKDAVHIFIRFLRCSSGTVAQECTWVLDTLISYYVSSTHPDYQQNIKEFVKLDLPFNLTETFKLNCFTTTQCALKILKQLLDSAQTVELKLEIVNEKIVCKVLDLLNQQQRLLVFKVILEFIIKLTQIPKIIELLMQCQTLPYLYKIIKNPDQKYNTLGLKALQSIISNAEDPQLIQMVEQGLFQNIKEFLDQNEDQVINNIVGLQIIEQILEAGDCIYSNVKGQKNQFKLKMDQSGLLQNIEDLQLSEKEAVSDKAVQIIERFCLQKDEKIEEEEN